MLNESMIKEKIDEYMEKTMQILESPKFNFLSSEVVHGDSGIYVIYDKRDGSIIYVGKTNNLKRRLFQNHKSGNIKGSQFRRALKEYYSFKDEKDISQFIKNNCVFQFYESDVITLLEHFLIAILLPRLNR
jgi:predicted GIY-YIG superfamily endonuclease